MTQTIKEYAQALFALACEEGIKKEIFKTVNETDKLFSDNPDYIQLLSSPAVPVEERISLIDKAFENNVHQYMLSFLKLLCEKGHIGSFKECAEEFNKMVDFSNRVLTAKVTSAVPLSEKEEKALIEKLEKMTGNTVLLDVEVNDSILGGMIVEIDGKVIDGSLQNRLNLVKDVIGR